MASSEYSVKFLSGKYRGGEFALPEKEEVAIGRGAEQDLVLMEDMVSRLHARIRCVEDEVVLEDLGSTNGTFVNGQQIRKVRLKAGDRILLGTSILKLIHRTDGAYSRMKSLAEASHDPEPAPESRPSLAGTIGDISVPELLQLLSVSRKDGVLAVQSGRLRARIHLQQGQVRYCAISGKEHFDPRKALYRLLTWEEGRFELQKSNEELFENPITESTEALIMDGVRQLDEYNNIKKDLPAPNALLELELPILPPLRALTPELLDTMQLVHNLGRLEAVLDQSAASDLDTCEELLYLLRHRYVRQG